jgi:hypothetical protein
MLFEDTSSVDLNMKIRALACIMIVDFCILFPLTYIYFYIAYYFIYLHARHWKYV